MTESCRTYFAHRLLRARDFQARPEFLKVRDWWRDRGVGLCVLVGIGGAGKTAITDRFLRVLPKALDPDLEVPKDETLRAPGALIVFSFYEVQSPQIFFAHLHAFIKGEAYDDAAPRPSYYQTQAALRDFHVQGGLLLCLDGIEKVQDDGLRGGVFGAIQDGSFRDFVERIADGYFPGVSALISTRYPVASLEEEQPVNYIAIPVDDLSEETSISLLWQRGVKGDRNALQRLASDCGFHALTLDLVGGYLVEFHGGDPKAKLDLPGAAAIERAVQKEPNARRRRVLKQSFRLSRLAGRYREAMEQNDPAAIALMERICLFRLPVEAAFLSRIFLGADKASVSGPLLAALTEDELQSKLSLLSEMRLIEESGGAYTVHPAVRDGFLNTFEPKTARLGHEAVLAGLQGQVEKAVSMAQSLDQLEEVVYHTLAAGHVSEAFRLLLDRLEVAILPLMGECQRVERLCRTVAGSDDPSRAPPPQGINEGEFSNIVLGWSIALTGLGRLSVAVAGHARVCAAMTDEHSIALCFQCENALLRGRLHEAERYALAAVEADDHVDFLMWRGYVSYVLGNRAGAFSDLHAVLARKRGKDDLMGLAALRADWVCSELIAFRRSDEAAALLSEIFAVVGTDWETPARKYAFEQFLRKLGVSQAGIFLSLGKFKDARAHLQDGYEWALARDLQEIICTAALTGARIALGETVSVPANRDALVREAIDQCQEGLRIARSCGYGIFHIDLLNVRAAAYLHQGNPTDAERDVRLALFEGVPARPDGDLPELLAATSPDCGYVPGQIEGYLRLAEALLLRARHAVISSPLVAQAREQLNLRRDLQLRSEDPGIAETDALIAQVDAGWLTGYPDAPALIPADTLPAKRKVMQAPVDFVIITPLKEETDAVLSKLPGWVKVPPSKKDGRLYFSSELPVKFSDDSAGSYKIVVVPLINMGELDAANATGDAIRRWKPRHVILVGIAGGLAKAGVALGDVLIADHVANYEVQRLNPDKAEIRWSMHRVNEQMLGASRFPDAAWQERVTANRPKPGEPKPHSGVICTGNKVIANGLADTYREIWTRLIGVEMEAGGVASAAFSRVRAPGFFMVRSVSDLADKEKDAGDTVSWRAYACDVAAAFAIALLASGPIAERG